MEYMHDYSDCKNNQNGECSLFGTNCRIRKEACLSYSKVNKHNDRMCPRCHSNKGGFDTPTNRDDCVICGNCGCVIPNDGWNCTVKGHLFSPDEDEVVRCYYCCATLDEVKSSG